MKPRKKHNWDAVRTHEEVARIMTERGFPMGRSRVQQIEQEVFDTLRDELHQAAAEHFDWGDER